MSAKCEQKLLLLHDAEAGERARHDDRRGARVRHPAQHDGQATLRPGMTYRKLDLNVTLTVNEFRIQIILEPKSVVVAGHQ